MNTPLVAAAYFKVRAASAVDPYLPTAVAPGSVVDAVRVAALANDPYTLAGVCTARFAVHIIRGAINRSRLVRLPSGLPYLEVRAASAVDPNAMLVIPPARAPYAL